MQPVGHQNGIARGRGGDHKLAFGDEAGRVRLGICVDAKGFGQIGGAGFCLCRIAAPDEKAGEWAHLMGGDHLQTGLHAGSHDAGSLDIRRSQMAGGGGSSGGGAHIGEKAIVEQKRFHEPGFRRKQDHQAVEARQADFRIVEETGADLDGEPVETGNIGGFHIHLAMNLRNVHGEDGWHDDVARGERAEGFFHHVDGFEVEPNGLAQIGFGQDKNIMRHGVLP